MLPTPEILLALSSLIFLILDLTAALSVLTPTGTSFHFTTTLKSLHVQRRDSNMTLTNNLLSVLRVNVSSPITRRDIDIASYESTIIANAAALDDIYEGAIAMETASIDRVALACAAAQLVFGNNVITPASSNYKTEEEINWSSTAWLPAACFFKAQNSIEVALALSLVTTLKTTFAVRGAGHNPNTGFSSVGNNGFLIDLEAMNHITLNADKSIASIEPASTWDAVYGYLEEFNLTVAGGRAAGVGVGGLLLGGGMSHFSDYWGLASDNVLNYEVVLADSTITQVNANENADLFKALKGGGPNFGIVTRFDVQTFAGSQIWYQLVAYAISDKVAIMEALVAIQEAMLLDDNIGLFLSDTPAAFTAGMVYKSASPGIPSAFSSAFGSITPLQVAIPATNGTFQSFATALASANGNAWQIGALTVGMDANLYAEMHELLLEHSNNTSISLSFTFQPFSARGVAQGTAKGGDSLGIASQNQSWIAFSASWPNSTLAAEAISSNTGLMAAMSNAASAKGELLPLEYMNDANSLQNPINSYGPSNVAYLKEVAMKYDPNGVFQKLQNSGFLLSKV